MGARQNAWGKRAIAAVREVLGGRCMTCRSITDLELHCIERRYSRHHFSGASSRASFYRRELAQGNLALLCRSCHRSVTAGWYELVVSRQGTRIVKIERVRSGQLLLPAPTAGDYAKPADV